MYGAQRLAIASFVFTLAATFVSAQDGPSSKIPAGWTAGPSTGQLGSRAKIEVPEGFFFLDGQATAKFLTDMQNVPDGDEVGALVRYRSDEDNWFVIFSYNDVGHIDDRDRDKLDASALLASIKKGTEMGNEQRRKKGWSTMDVVGWAQPPFYDTATNNLTWAINGKSSDAPQDIVVNRSVRLLGRTGYMSAQLVVGASRAEATTAEFNELLRGYTFDAGHRYAEFMRGDKLAGYGLSALVGAGAAGVAIKSGLLQKFWKLIVVGIVGLVAGIKRFFAKLSGKAPATQPTYAEPEVYYPRGERKQ